MSAGPTKTAALEDPTRLVEIWNLVFIQYDRGADGALTPLPSRHVDTGMGFERMLSILQGVDSNYDTDVFRPLMDHIGELSQHPYAKGDTDVAYRVVADHVRALAFAIADGALPSNEGRGYVLQAHPPPRGAVWPQSRPGRSVPLPARADAHRRDGRGLP